MEVLKYNNEIQIIQFLFIKIIYYLLANTETILIENHFISNILIVYGSIKYLFILIGIKCFRDIFINYLHLFIKYS